MVDIPSEVAARAAARYTVEGECWISDYSVQSTGYAQIGWSENGRTRMTLAHRASWVHSSGEQIPSGLTIDHICRTKRCVRPEHLRLLSNYENARRSHRDFPLGQCSQGHSHSGPGPCPICKKKWRDDSNRKRYKGAAK